MITHMTFDRLPTIGDLHRVTLYDDKGVPVSEHLAELSVIVSARRDVCFVHICGGKRPGKTYRRPTPRAADECPAGGLHNFVDCIIPDTVEECSKCGIRR